MHGVMPESADQSFVLRDEGRLESMPMRKARSGLRSGRACDAELNDHKSKTA